MEIQPMPHESWVSISVSSGPSSSPYHHSHQFIWELSGLRLLPSSKQITGSILDFTINSPTTFAPGQMELNKTHVEYAAFFSY